MTFQLPPARSVAVNPTQEQMRSWALEHLPRCTETIHGNIAYQARITSRQGPSTFFVSDEPTGKPTISRAEAATWAARQDEHVADLDMILIEGWIGPDPDVRTGAQLYMDRRNANIPAMQQQLYFPPDDDHVAEFTVIYTPHLVPEGMPNGCLIIVDLDNWVTRVFGSDYFGESKMGGLRMWNKLVHDRGGLAMHSGAKVFPADASADGEERLALIIGLSGTGKTTTTFREVLGSEPVQDDFIGLMPGGTVHATENGCFAKTFGLDPRAEPAIHGGATSPEAWLESTVVDPDTGEVDFLDGSVTRNGRVTFSLDMIRHRDPRDLPPAHWLFILNRTEDIIPAVARLAPDQAARYFMLGETKGTSAGGASEAGRKLRVPGTNPFWFEEDSSQGNRLLELLETTDLEVFLFNTGRVGGGEDVAGSRKVEIRHSAAVQEGIVGGTITWEVDPDFGYEVATSLPGVDDELCRPRLLYQRQGRLDEYQRVVESLIAEREAYLEGFSSLDPRIRKFASTRAA